MKHTYIFTILLLFNTLTANSQVSIKCKVLDNDSIPLQYVNVGIIGTTYGTVSDFNGNFQFEYDTSNVLNNDSIKVSMIGYESKYLTISSIKNSKNISIILQKKDYEINEVIVKPSVNKEIGRLNKSLFNLFVNFAISDIKNNNLGSEIGKKYNIRHKTTLISKLKFYIQNNNFDSVIFRVNVYSVKRNKPYKNLLKQNILVHVNNKKTGWIIIDLDKYNIVVSNDIVVSIEWLSKSKKGNLLTLPIATPTPHIHYYKYGSQNNWKRYLTMTTMMKLEVKY